MSESLKKVEQFSELTPGVRVRCGCECGAGSHDGIITGSARVATVAYLDGSTGVQRLVPCSPTPPCAQPSSFGHAVAEVMVRMGWVYRYVDYDPAAERAEDAQLRRWEKAPSSKLDHVLNDLEPVR